MIRVGVLGAGQLALMLAEAADELKRTGIEIEVVCAGSAGDCAARVARVVETDLEDAGAVQRFASQVDVVTVESENLEPHVLEGLSLRPNVCAVGVAQDRWLEKKFLLQCGIPVAPFAKVDSAEDLRAAVAELGLPSILKTRRMGYDGKGQFRLHAAGDVEAAWTELGRHACILEGFVSFVRELSLLAVRGADGAIAFYPLTENVHREGILRVSTAPFADEALQREAEDHMRRLLVALDYVGVLAVEFFVVDGALVANEMAPRVHNSGHWTIEGSATSQFANHLRAICGFSLGDTASRAMVMLNCIGTMPDEASTEMFAELLRHDYGKEPRPGRKVGHLTFPASATDVIGEWRRRLGV